MVTSSAGVAEGEGAGDGRVVALALVVTRGGAAACLFLLCEDTRWYALNPMMPSRTTTTIRLRLGERRSRILIGVDGSNTSAARIAPSGPCSASYSLISGSGSRPMTVPMLRM